MGRVVVCVIVSLDGFSAGSDGDVTALPFDDGFDAYGAERLRAADTGRTSYEQFHAHWPGIAADPDASEIEREISRLHDAAHHVVVSDSLTVAEGEPWFERTTIAPRVAAHRTVRHLRATDGGDVLVFGSGTVWNDLLVAGLVDELHLLVGPTLLAEGVPVFSGPPTSLRLIEARRLDDSSLVLHRFDARPH